MPLRKPGYRVGLTIQELEARPARAAEAQRRNALLVYPPVSTLLQRKVARGQITSATHAALYLHMLQMLHYPGADEPTVRRAYSIAVGEIRGRRLIDGWVVGIRQGATRAISELGQADAAEAKTLKKTRGM